MPAFLKQFLSTSYWFGAPPNVTSGPGLAVLAFFVLCVLASIVLRAVVLRRIAERNLQALVRRIASLMTALGIVGLILAAFSYENASFFGERFWYGLLLLLALGWGGWLAWYGLKTLPRLRAAELAKREKQKYLP